MASLYRFKDLHCRMLASVYAPRHGQRIVTEPQPPTSQLMPATNPVTGSAT